MPNIITHYLFAAQVKSTLQSKKLLTAINRYPDEFIIGSNGPDFLFFYKYFSKQARAVEIRELGNLFHSSHINDFYRIALTAVKNERDEALRSGMMSYVAGHLCHWALDSTAHPYIFYRTGDCQGQSASWHHRFESMLDTMMLKKILNTDVKAYDYPKLASRGVQSVEIIAKIYCPIIQEVFKMSVTTKEIQDALSDWEFLQKVLHDPHRVKFTLLKPFEKAVRHPWLFSGNVVPVKIDPTYDVLNEAHTLWKYPADPHRTSHESFMELFDKAVILANEVIMNMDDVDECLHLLDNRTYDSGVQPGVKMVEFDCIYEK